jgi:hypothetical protein
LDKDVPKPHFYKSLGVLQIVKTLDKIVQFSNFIYWYTSCTQQRNEVPGDHIFKLNNFI